MEKVKEKLNNYLKFIIRKLENEQQIKPQENKRNDLMNMKKNYKWEEKNKRQYLSRTLFCKV